MRALDTRCISIKADSVRCGPHGTSQTRRTLSHFECPRHASDLRLVWDVPCGPHLTESALIEMQYDMDQERIEREKNSGTLSHFECPRHASDPPTKTTQNAV
jgi:hypothetical protein